MTIQWVGAAQGNYEIGRRGTKIDTIVLHWIVGNLSAADAQFLKSGTQVSAHYGIGDTVVHQYVSENDTAYHAGNFTVNLRSIGIEHQGGPTLPISDLTHETSAQLVANICKKWNIPIDATHIVPHSSIKATQCPGTLNIARIIARAKQINQVNVPPTTDWEKKYNDEKSAKESLQREFDEYKKKTREVKDRLNSFA